MAQPEPVTLASPLAPSAVVQTAAQVLAAKGFTLTTSDAAGGIIVAARPVVKGTSSDWFACRWGPDAFGSKITTGSLTVTVTARPATAGSAVMIVGTAHSVAHLDGLPDTPDKDCVSNGKTERAIASAVSVR